MWIIANVMQDGGAPLVSRHRAGNAVFEQFAHCVLNGIACRVVAPKKLQLECKYNPATGLCTVYAGMEEYTLPALVA